MVRGGGLDIEVATRGEFQTEEMILNIGPQHPVDPRRAAGGARARRRGDHPGRAGDRLHAPRRREARRVPRRPPDPRADEPPRLAVSAFNNELGLDDRRRALAGIEVPERAQWIRTMFAEWNRILNHLMFSGSYPLELGAMTPMFYAFREREMIQDLMESATGARMHHSYCRVGGLKDDLPRGFLKRVRRGARRGAQASSRSSRPDHGQRDHLRALSRRRGPPARDGDRVRLLRARCCRRSGVADGSPQGRAVREVRRGRVRGAGRERPATATTGCGCWSSG